MNRFVIVDGLPYLLAHGKTYAVRWDDKGFTVGMEVKLASIPSVTHGELAIKAKCAGRLDSIAQQTTPDKQEQEDQEPETPANEAQANQELDEQFNLDGMTVKQLKEYAKEHGIDLGDATKKLDIIAVILNAEDVDSDDPDD